MKKKIITLMMVAALMAPATTYAADIDEQDGIVTITGAEDGFSYTTSVTVTCVVPDEDAAVGGSVTGDRWISLPATVAEEEVSGYETMSSTISSIWDKLTSALVKLFV